MDKEKLIEIAKRKCNITWEDEETELKITEIVEDAIDDLKEKLGKEAIDFSKEGKARKLFKNYCFYEWNNKSEEFDKNYKNDIMQLRQKYEVEEYVKEN